MKLLKAFLIVIGILLLFVAGTIIYQDVYNELQLENHPVQSALTFRNNFIGEGEHENYLYPYSARELKVLGMALAGIFLAIAGFTLNGNGGGGSSSGTSARSSRKKKKD